jgi:putative effector of murein hydrolase
MSDFVELWTYLSTTPLFGLASTLALYLVTSAIYKKLNQHPLANPVLWTVIVLALSLTLLQVPYQTYFSGAQFIHFLLGPAVVALAWPLWLKRVELMRRLPRLFMAALVGGVVSAVLAVAMAWLLDLPQYLAMSLAPKSVTAPVAMGLAATMGGLPELAAIFAVLTGLIGALLGKYIFDFIHIARDTSGWAQRGFALGTISHGIGAARAIQIEPTAGAFAGLALGLQVILASLWMPVMLWVILWLNPSWG